MPFKSKDIRAVLDAKEVILSIKPAKSENEIIKIQTFSGFREDELDFYREARAKRLEAMYAEMATNPRYMKAK